jgi:hypothetical protein
VQLINTIVRVSSTPHASFIMDGLIDFARKSSHEADFQPKFTEQLTKAGKKYAGQWRRGAISASNS